MISGHKLDYSQINEYIYLGSNACCQTHFKESLLRKGIRADISMEEKRMDTPFGVKFYLWLPVKDLTAPSMQQMETGAIFLDSLVKNKIKTYVHCKNGHGRSTTLVAAYFIINGYGADETLRIIRKKRPSIHLQKSQIESLKRFERKISD